MLERIIKKPVDALTQKQLIQKAQNGDDEALITLICGVYAYLNHQVNFETPHKDDLKCCMLLGVWKALLKYDPNREVPFVAYAARVSYSEIITYCRKHSISLLSLDKTNQEGNSLFDAIIVEDPNLLEVEGRRDVLWALLQLPPDQRLVIYYRFVRGWERKPTARKLKMKLSRLKRVQTLAISNLRRLLNYV